VLQPNSSLPEIGQPYPYHIKKTAVPPVSLMPLLFFISLQQAFLEKGPHSQITQNLVCHQPDIN